MHQRALGPGPPTLPHVPRAIATSLIDGVLAQGADTVFGLPGGGPNLEVVGAADRAGLRFVLLHGETAAAITASTYGLLVGRPALVIATRGPGAASIVNGAAQATLDRYPLLVVTDCVPSDQARRVEHQRIDQPALFAPVTKASGRLGVGDRDAVVDRALRLAASAPSGAVHLDLDPGEPSELRAPAGSGAEPRPAELARARSLLTSASRPVAIVGLGAVDDAAAVRAALERLGCPVLPTYQATGILPPDSPQLGVPFTNGAMERRLLERADLILAVGLDAVEPIPAPWTYEAPIVAVTPVPSTTDYLPVDVELVGPPGALLDELGAARSNWPVGAAHAERERVLAEMARAVTGRLGPVEVVDVVAARTPAAATVTVDAGAHFLAIMPRWPVPAPLRLLISNGLATMGFAVPAAIGAGLARPGHPVLCLVGDGGLSMTMAELETIARLSLPVTVVVFDDAALSLIAIKQREDHGDASAVSYSSVDFAAVARAMGLNAATVTSARELGSVLTDGWDRPRLVDVRIDPTPYRELLALTRG